MLSLSGCDAELIQKMMAMWIGYLLKERHPQFCKLIVSSDDELSLIGVWIFLILRYGGSISSAPFALPLKGGWQSDYRTRRFEASRSRQAQSKR